MQRVGDLPAEFDGLLRRQRPVGRDIDLGHVYKIARVQWHG